MQKIQYWQQDNLQYIFAITMCTVKDFLRESMQELQYRYHQHVSTSATTVCTFNSYKLYSLGKISAKITVCAARKNTVFYC